MVAVRFEGLEGSCAVEDCYVSVRVGDVQKLSRMTSSRRVYQFPEPPEGQKYGRVEIFRRIGSSSIDLDPQVGTRAVRLSCQEPGLSEVTMQVTVEDDPPKGLPAVNEHQRKRSDVRQAATDYLGKHSIESQLSAVMKAVLQEMPENPTEFLANRLLKEPSVDGRLRLVPVSARLDTPSQERTLPRSPCEPCVQRGRKPHNGVRKLAPLGLPKGGSSKSSFSPAPPLDQVAEATGQPSDNVLDLRREPDLDYHDVLDLAYSSAGAEGAVGFLGVAPEATFREYYRRHIAGSNVAEGTARSLFTQKQEQSQERPRPKSHEKAPFSVYYRQQFVGSKIVEGIARRRFLQMQDAQGPAAELNQEALSAAAGDDPGGTSPAAVAESRLATAGSASK